MTGRAASSKVPGGILWESKRLSFLAASLPPKTFCFCHFGGAREQSETQRPPRMPIMMSHGWPLRPIDSGDSRSAIMKPRICPTCRTVSLPPCSISTPPKRSRSAQEELAWDKKTRLGKQRDVLTCRKLFVTQFCCINCDCDFMWFSGKMCSCWVNVHRNETYMETVYFQKPAPYLHNLCSVWCNFQFPFFPHSESEAIEWLLTML